MDTLQNIWNHLKIKGKASDKGDVHSYIPLYEALLAPYKECNKVLEIGLLNGYSHLMFEYYFYNAEVYGVDCSDTPLDGMADLRPLIEEGSHNILIFDAANAEQARKHFEGMKFDVVIDDANHNIEQNVDLFNIYKNFMAEGGIYLIEDVQDLEATKHIYESLAENRRIEIFDRRNVKGRYDDIVVAIYF